MVWSSINTGGVILTPQFLLCNMRVIPIDSFKLIDNTEGNYNTNSLILLENICLKNEWYFVTDTMHLSASLASTCLNADVDWLGFNSRFIHYNQGGGSRRKPTVA